jgi:hypothetical protein
MAQPDAHKAKGWKTLEDLVIAGYRVIDVDSNDIFVGVRLERGNDRRTVVLTRDDFRAIFPST